MDKITMIITVIITSLLSVTVSYTVIRADYHRLMVTLRKFIDLTNELVEHKNENLKNGK